MSSFWQFTWPHTCVFVLLILFKFTISTSKSTSVSYSKQCASVVPEATPTTYSYVTFPSLQTSTSFFTGVERIFGKNSSHTSPILFSFQSSSNVYATNTSGVYKIDAELTFQGFNYYPVSIPTDGKSSHRRWRSGILKFLLNGFWSESSGKGCFVGSAPWYSSIGEPLKLEAVFMINHSKSSTYFNSFITGNLKSLSHLNDEGYFEPISILSFPQVNRFEYQLISKETLKHIHAFENIEKCSVLGSHPRMVCSLFNRNYITFKLEYASSCSSSLKNCSPLDEVLGYRPTYVSLYSIQCSECGNKMRFLVQLTNRSYVGMYEMFDPSATLVGEGMWDETKNCLVIVACRISSSDSLEDAHVGDCSFRFSLYFPSVWSLKNRDQAAGQIWTNKTTQDVGYFGRIKFRTSDANINVPGFMYEYTEIERVKKLCPKKAVTRGERFPSGQSSDMRFDMSVSNSTYFPWNYVAPIFIGNESYAYIAGSEVEFENVVSDNFAVNVSYKITFSSLRDSKLEAGLSSLNTSLNSDGGLVIFAEGVYDTGTGYLCMVGCRDLPSNNSLDCDILLTFQFPGSYKTKGGVIKGSMQSTRKQSDPLFFEHLNMTSSFSTSPKAQRSIWRIDLEISMVLISNTLACMFVHFQLHHVRRYPNTLPYISLVMLVILTLGHMMSLVQAFCITKQNTHNTMLSSSGWFEVNEVIVNLKEMAVFLVQYHLLQLAWTARQSGESNTQGISVAGKKTLLFSLPMYVVGGLIAFVVNLNKHYYGNAPPTYDYSQAHHKRHTLQGDLRSYTGLILDGFLFPQLLCNIFQISRQSALYVPLYLGTSFVHIVPHAYDIYRANNYVHAMRTLICASSSADLYSAAWDTIIPLGALLLAVIIFLQQRYGGRVIVPRKFRKLE